MSKETVTRFQVDLQQRIDYFRQEYHISYAEAVGVLEILKTELVMEIVVLAKDEGDVPE